MVKGKTMKNYDVTIVGAGPGGIFTAYELSKKAPQLNVAIIEYGNPLEKRKCPIDGEKITDVSAAVSMDNIREKGSIMVRRGKKAYKKITV